LFNFSLSWFLYKDGSAAIARSPLSYDDQEIIMKSPPYATGALLFICALTLEGNLIVRGAQATESIGTSAWDVGQVPLEVSETTHQLIGVYGDVRVRDKTGTIKDRTHPEKTLSIDLQRLDPLDWRRLNSQCSLKVCPEILMGYIIQGRLQATRSYTYENINRIVVPPDPPASAASRGF
jgi:hypothetical protein